MSMNYGNKFMKKLPTLFPPPRLDDEVIYLDDNFNVVSKDEATWIKIVENGQVTFGKLVEEE